MKRYFASIDGSLVPDDKGGLYIAHEADREIRKQKRKRCLAMAEYCNAKWILAVTERSNLFWMKWIRVFTQLADKFKEL